MHKPLYEARDPYDFYWAGYAKGVSDVRAFLTAPESEFMDKVILLKRIDELLCRK